jgi:ferritin-like metal-binding protein YciE
MLCSSILEGDLYLHELKDLYSVEKQLIVALPKVTEAAKNEKLGAGFRNSRLWRGANIC